MKDSAEVWLLPFSFLTMGDPALEAALITLLICLAVMGLIATLIMVVRK